MINITESNSLISTMVTFRSLAQFLLIFFHTCTHIHPRHLSERLRDNSVENKRETRPGYVKRNKLKRKTIATEHKDGTRDLIENKIPFAQFIWRV